MTLDGAPALLKPQRVADLPGVNAHTVRRWIRNGTIPTLKIGTKLTRVRRGDLERHLQPKELWRLTSSVCPRPPANQAG